MKTKDNREIRITKLSLHDLLDIFLEKGFSEIHNLISSLDLPTNQFTFYKAKYKFGVNIISKGVLQFSLEDNNLISINDPLTPPNIADDILGSHSLSNDPLGIIINNCAEGYLKNNGMINTEHLLHPGDFIGVPRALDPQNPNRSSILSYDVSAGSKSAFLLQSVRDRNVYNKIAKDLNLDIAIPESPSNFSQTFADIANHVSNDWFCEIIFFPRNFIDLITQKEFAPLYVYLNQVYVKNYSVKHNIFNLWQLLHFSKVEKDKLSLKYNFLYLQAIRYIFLVAAKSAVAFTPSTSDTMGPFSKIKAFFEKEYGVQNPIIMEPTFFDYDLSTQKPVYLGVMYQEYMRDIAEALSRRTKISILQDLSTLLNMYTSSINNNDYLKETTLGKLLKNVNIEYYHNSLDIKVSKHINSAEEIIKNDSRFSTDANNISGLAGTNFFTAGIVIKKL